MAHVPEPDLLAPGHAQPVEGDPAAQHPQAEPQPALVRAVDDGDHAAVTHPLRAERDDPPLAAAGPYDGLAAVRARAPDQVDASAPARPEAERRAARGRAC